jgi:transposase, IS5 family
MAVKKVYQLNLASGLLQTILRPDHELVLLAERIDWEALEDKLVTKFSQFGREAKRVRLMIGLHFLKHLYNLSDERVCAMLEENVYFRFFCGVHCDLREWQEAQLLNPCTMSRFRKRLGIDGMQMIEDVIKLQLCKEGRVSGRTQVVDTTAMEKNIAYPLDSGLLARGMNRVASLVNKLKKRKLSVSVRSYKRLIRREILSINKLGRGRKERVSQSTKRLAKYAKSVHKEAERALRAVNKKASKKEAESIERLKEALKAELDKLSRVVDQAERRLAGELVPAKEKIFSMHEPDVTVIAKGKRKKRYEFGAKVSFSMDRNGYVVGHQEYQRNLGDQETLDPAISDWRRTFGDYPVELGADRGYTGSNPSESLALVKKVIIPSRGKKKHPDHGKAHYTRVLKTRNKIEPMIGHLKTDHRLDRCRYAGTTGDTLNAGFATTAWNLKKWVRELTAEARESAA